jgi:nucleotide-binding universal stress UspA family protein
LLHATSPVAVVPEGASSDGGEVVVGVDGSEGASAALRWAVEEAVARGAKLCVINAWQFEAKTAPADYRYAAINWEAFSQGSHELVRQEVEQAIAMVGASPVAVDRVSSNQPPVQALLGRAGRDGLLVVGSRGRGGFAGLMLGSVSQHCLHHAHGPVVVLRHSKATSAT